MPLLASECIDESASVYLNDSAKTRWTTAILLPYLRSAYLELQAELEDNDLPPLHEISAVINVAIGVTELASPADMVLPIRLFERHVGETIWKLMDDRSWEPNADKDDRLNLWVYREGKIQLLGATSAVEVKLHYTRNLSAIASENSILEIGNAKGFLAARTAGLAATFGGVASARGEAANSRAEYFKSKIISTLVKRQGPIRRRRFPWESIRRR